MSFEDRFFAAIIKWLAAEKNISASKIVAVDQEQERVSDYGCDTCSYTRIVVEIVYDETDGRRGRIFTYKGDMGEFMRQLTDD